MFLNRWRTKLTPEGKWVVKNDDRVLCPEPNTFDTYVAALKRSDRLNIEEQYVQAGLKLPV